MRIIRAKGKILKSKKVVKILSWIIWDGVRYLYETKLNKIKFGSEIVETVFSKGEKIQ